jgi:hypothetical protein
MVLLAGRQHDRHLQDRGGLVMRQLAHQVDRSDLVVDKQQRRLRGVNSLEHEGFLAVGAPCTPDSILGSTTALRQPAAGRRCVGAALTIAGKPTKTIAGSADHPAVRVLWSIAVPVANPAARRDPHEQPQPAHTVTPVTIPQKKCDPVAVTRDEHPRETSLEALGKLEGVVRPDGAVTAGNASGVNDGSCASMSSA